MTDVATPQPSTLNRDGNDGGAVFLGIALLALALWFYDNSYPAAIALVASAVLLYKGINAPAPTVDRAANEARELATLPERVPDAINATPELFAEGLIRVVTEGVPPLSKNPLRFSANQEALQAHVAYLNGINDQARAQIEVAIGRYETDQKAFEAQQRILYRMVHQAGLLVSRVEARFPAIKGDLSTVPAPAALRLPAAPAVISSLLFAKRQQQLRKGTSRGMARVTANMVTGRGTEALAGLAVIGALNVISFQWTVRKVYDAQGQVSNYAARSACSLIEIGCAHAEMVSVSAIIHADSLKLRELLLWANAWEPGLSQEGETEVTDEVKTNLLALKKHALITRLQTARAI